ncbi:MAG: NAD-dependent epimerase/dehydratase family protein [Methylococcales bacterium]|nr:NAD-dependent epimerase/dehydratase family protein [Methylococcales bacterium]
MNEAQTIAVTGASGFVGQRLVERLTEAGHRVVCLLRPSSDAGALIHPQLRLTRGALTDAAFVDSALAGCDSVIHCAAMVSDWGTVAEIRRANVEATQTLVEAAQRVGIKQFIHISSTDVYGHPGTAKVSEADPGSLHFSNWYAETKKAAEQVLLASALNYTILRPATIYGPGSKSLVGEIGKAVQSGFMLLVSGGQSNAGLVYIDNLIDAIELTLHNPKAARETFNIADASQVSWAEFVGQIGKGLGARYRVLNLPYPLAWALGAFLELGYRHIRRLTGWQTQALLSRQAVQILGIDQDFAIDKARQQLGFTPGIDFDQGMANTLKWLRQTA